MDIVENRGQSPISVIVTVKGCSVEIGSDPDFPMKKISRSAIVGHSAAELYALVEDIEAYPKFLPWCRQAQVHERAASETRATLTLGVSGVRHSFTTRNENRPGEAIDMRLVEGPFR